MWWMAGGAMAHKHLDNKSVNEYWKEFLETGYESSEHRLRRIFGFLPSTHRCKICFSPFDGAPGAMVRFVFDKRPSNMSPQICNFCEEFAKKHQGGAEVELTMLFVDVRGSTTLAESMSVSEFSQLINRFYITASDILVRTEAWIDKIIGDQVAGLYFPGLAGPTYTQKAIEAARQIMEKTGHGSPEGPWIPLGAGVHRGVAYVGAVGTSDGTQDITVLGDAPNTAARLSSSAAHGEILISEAALSDAGMASKGLETRQLTLKGKSELIHAYVMTDYSP
jgi:adenylate cyclase